MHPSPMPPEASARLQVRQLRTVFHTDEGAVPSVAEVSFSIAPGRTTALVGESGSGKSVTSLTLMRLLSRNARTEVSGQALFRTRAGQLVDLLRLPEKDLRALRGNELAMIFQEPMTSLNPVLSIGEQIAESVRLHKGLDRAAALAHARRMLERVEIPAAAQRLREYPHQLSGGMRQRVMIAMALSCNPKLLLADEPTTALDVTIQAQILDLLRQLQEEFKMAVIIITHNLGVVAEFADRVLVMYAGRTAEQASVENVFDRPAHPYTEGLIASIPDLDADVHRLTAIPGTLPNPQTLPPGCRFQPRCGYARDACATGLPPLVGVEAAHYAACIRHTGYRFDVAGAAR